MTTLNQLRNQAVNAENSVATHRTGKHVLQVERCLNAKLEYYFEYRKDAVIISVHEAAALLKQPRRLKHVCTCADQDFCFVHPTDTECLDPNGPWGEP